MMRRGQNNGLDSIDRLSREIVRAVRVGDEEMDATAGSPDLYRRVRSEIAARRGLAAAGNFDRRRQNPIRLLPGLRLRANWAFAGVVALLSLAIMIGILIARPSVEKGSSGQQATAPQSRTTPSGNVGGETVTKTAQARDDGADQRPRRVKPRSGRRHLRAMPPDSYTAEVATDFLPLTYIADSAQMDSGHVVRVKMPRSALVSFGLPMNYERASELVKADVLIGDDGLARAIRFVQ
jgi:hypothetical protein